MTTSFETTHATHLTAARARLFDGATKDTMNIGFNPVATAYFGTISKVIRSFVGTDHRVTGPIKGNAEEAPFVSEYVEVQPPLNATELQELGQMLVARTLEAGHTTEIDGFGFYDNRGHNQPVNAVDRGDVIAQVLPANMRQQLSQIAA